MKKAAIGFVLAFGVWGCATTSTGPDRDEDSFAESIARGFAEGLFDAMFHAAFGDGGTAKVAHRQDRWLSSKVQTSVSSPR
ncbi:MAG TPA: hypothetical protein VIV54_23080 [Burkholderiales bacterium]